MSIKNLLGKLLPGINDKEAESLPSYDQRAAANLQQRGKFSPVEIKMLRPAIEMDGQVQTTPFKLSIMDDRTLPSRLRYKKPRDK